MALSVIYFKSLLIYQLLRDTYLDKVIKNHNSANYQSIVFPNNTSDFAPYFCLGIYHLLGSLTHYIVIVSTDNNINSDLYPFCLAVHLKALRRKSGK